MVCTSLSRSGTIIVFVMMEKKAITDFQSRDRLINDYLRTAIASISIFTSLGKRATSTQERAG